MNEYSVNTGLNLGKEGARFEVGDVIDEATLEELTTKKARKWLLDNEYITKKETEVEPEPEPAGEEE